MKRPLVLILIVAAALRLLLSTAVGPADERRISIDSMEYLALAGDLVASYTDSSSEHFGYGLKRGPVYPLLLAAASRLSVRPAPLVGLVQIGFDLGSIAIVWLLALRLGGGRAAITAALLLAVDPVSVIYSQYLLTESSFTLLVLCATLILVGRRPESTPFRSWPCATAGLLLGVALLLRPIATYLPVALAPTLLLFGAVPWRRRLVATTLFVVGFAAIPLLFRAVREGATGVAIVSTIEAENQLLIKAGRVEALVRHQRIEETVVALRQELGIEDGWGPDPVATTRAVRRRALQILLAHPLVAARSTLEGSVKILFGPGNNALAKLLGLPALPLATLVVLLAPLGVVHVLALAGVRSLAAARRWTVLAPLALTIAYLVVAASGSSAYSRYRVPATPYLVMLAGAGVARRGSGGDPFRDTESGPFPYTQAYDRRPADQRDR